jgi:hypothetical protein
MNVAWANDLCDLVDRSDDLGQSGAMSASRDATENWRERAAHQEKMLAMLLKSSVDIHKEIAEVVKAAVQMGAVSVPSYCQPR